jgi:hypothetical protein
VVEEDSPSSSAPPLGDAVTSGLALGLGVPLVDELAVAAPCIVGEVVAYGLAVAVARGLGDAVVGRGEAVVAGEALWVWAEIEAITALTTASVTANRRDVFTGDKEFAPKIDHRAPKKESPHILAVDVETSDGVTKMQSFLCRYHAGSWSAC